MTFPPYASRDLVSERLPLIFPEGTANRNYCIRDLAAGTVFAALYIGAVEGADRYFGPVHVYRMTREQALKAEKKDRVDYAAAVVSRNAPIAGTRWYADLTREPIRDETLREGLIPVGAVLQRRDLPTTSGRPRYALKNEFAALFDPGLTGAALEAAIGRFQATSLSTSALARLSIMRAGAAAQETGVLVTFPNDETRRLAPGPSSFIAKQVVEVFARRFLAKPAVLWLSESGNKVVVRDDAIASSLGLRIEADRNLPDLILADLGPEEPLIVFVEVVATDGAIGERRREALLALTDAGGFDRRQVVFVTAYSDRQGPGFRKTIGHLAWGSFAWFASEPGKLMILRDGMADGAPLSVLL